MGAGHLGDLPLIPQSPILLGERNQLAFRAGAGRVSCVGQHHQGEKSCDFGIVRKQVVNGARQPDRLRRQVGAL